VDTWFVGTSIAEFALGNVFGQLQILCSESFVFVNL
jgi:hypothetical protein